MYRERVNECGLSAIVIYLLSASEKFASQGKAETVRRASALNGNAVSDARHGVCGFYVYPPAHRNVRPVTSSCWGCCFAHVVSE